MFRSLAAALLVTIAVPAAAAPVWTGLVGQSDAVGGYDPVSYFSGKPVEGRKEFYTEYKGATWRFASAANLAAFKAAPEKYAPQYGGHCAWAAANNYRFAADPKVWKIVGGKLYLNYNQEVQTKWNKDIPGLIAKADANWPALGR